MRSVTLAFASAFLSLAILALPMYILILGMSVSDRFASDFPIESLVR